MGIFNEFFKKEKPVFTGSRFGFGSGGGGGPAGPEAFTVSGASINPGGLVADNGYTYFTLSLIHI